MKEIALIRKIADQFGIDEDIFVAICMKESSLNPDAIRFEPLWKYFYYCQEHADLLKITLMTEKTLQSFSYGLCQIMGSVAREIGFKGPLTDLISDPETCLKYGAIHFRNFYLKYQNYDDAISAYNQGSNRKAPDGKYQNQTYVDAVLKNLSKISPTK